MLQPATLADLPAFLCAHAEDARAGTGCTVFIAVSYTHLTLPTIA